MNSSNFNIRKLISKTVSFRTVIILFVASCLLCAVPQTRILIISIMEKLLHRSLRNLAKWDNILLHTMVFFATMASFLYFFMYTKKGREVFADAVCEIKSIFTQKNTLRNLLIITGILFVSYWALIRTNYDYADDMRRTFSGHKAWVGWNRFISETLAVFIHTNFFINDIAPLTHIWTIGILTVAAYMLVSIATEKKLSLLTVFASVFFAITPFYNTNFAYKFDCPYMAIAILAGIFPFAFTKKRFNYIVISVFSLIVMCTSYQASNAIYIVMTAFITMRMVTEKEDAKKIIEFIGISILCYAVTMLLFRSFMMNTIERDPVLNHSSEMAEGGQFISTFITNFKTYFSMMISGYGNVWLKVLTALSIVLYPISCTIKTKSNRIITALLSITALFIMTALSFGCYLVLANPLIQYRAFMGIDIFVSLICIFNICALSETKILGNVNKCIVIALLYGFIVSSNVFGNFYDKQKDYEHFRMTILLQDLSRIITDSSKPTEVFIAGNYGCSAKTRMEWINYHLTAGNSPGLTEYLIKDWNMNIDLISEVPINMIERDPKTKARIQNLPVLVDNYYHTISGSSDFLYIYLKDPQLDEKQ